jgi:hypothetical protein
LGKQKISRKPQLPVDCHQANGHTSIIDGRVCLLYVYAAVTKEQMHAESPDVEGQDIVSAEAKVALALCAVGPFERAEVLSHE